MACLAATGCGGFAAPERKRTSYSAPTRRLMMRAHEDFLLSGGWPCCGSNHIAGGRRAIAPPASRLPVGWT